MSENNLGDELGKLPPDLTLGATSEQIIRRGRRIRTIRQTSIVGAAAVAVLGITSIAALAGNGHHGAQTVQSGSGNGLGIAIAPPSGSSAAPAASTSSAPPASAPASSPPASPTVWYAASTPPAASSAPASSSPSVSCTASPAPQSTDGAPPANPDGNAPAWGSLVQAGTDVGTGKSLVLYGFHIDDAAIPCTHFGLMVGTEDAAGTHTVTGVYAANEFDGSDLTPGFHAVSMVGKEVAGTYAVGYYVGPAASISVVVDGVPTAAHVAAWSVNPDVKFWWLGGSANGNPTIGALTAKDAKGNLLPVGAHAQAGVG
jgi:hypothetical protein